MKLFRKFSHIGYTLIADLFAVFFQEESKPHNLDFIKVRAMQVLDNMVGKVESATGDLLRNTLIILRVQVSTKNKTSFPIIKNIVQQCPSKADKVGISLLAHNILSFVAYMKRRCLSLQRSHHVLKRPCIRARACHNASSSNDSANICAAMERTGVIAVTNCC